MGGAAAAAVDAAFACGTKLANYGLGVDGSNLESRGKSACNDRVLEALGAVGNVPSLGACRDDVGDVGRLTWWSDYPLPRQPNLGREGEDRQFFPSVKVATTGR